MNLEDKLVRLLNDINSLRDIDFTGVGLIIYKNSKLLPISPLKKIDSTILLPVKSYKAILILLLKISKNENKYHDGFHLLNEKFELTHISQYVSPTIIKETNSEFEYGSRYKTALYTSNLKNVIACGIVSSNYRAKIFISGKANNCAF